ncbi:Serine/threonine protein kinase, partial [Globisporangium splendens]
METHPVKFAWKKRLETSQSSSENNGSVSPDVARSVCDRTLLYEAARGGRAEAVEALVASGVPVDDQDEFGQSALRAAVREGHVAVARTLLDAGATMDDNNGAVGEPLLFLAAKNGRADVVKLLVSMGASVHMKNRYGRTPLFVAVTRRHATVVATLIGLSACVGEEDNDGKTALYFATRHKNADMVKLLIDLGACVHDKDKSGKTALFAAAEHGYIDALKTLIEMGALVSVKDIEGETPLIVAAREGQVDVVAALIDAGASVEDKNISGETPLIVAASKGRVDVVRTLMEAGASISDKDNGGRTPLLVAASGGHAETVELLIKTGAVVDDAENCGETPLFAAAAKDHLDVAILLLESGASVNYKDQNGRTPLFSASSGGSVGIVELLIQMDATVDYVDNHGETPLVGAVENGHAGVVNLLIANCASDSLVRYVNSRSRRRRAVLSIASRSGDMDIFRALIEAGASINVQDHDGETPLMSIARWGYLKGVKLLIMHVGVSSNSFSRREAPLIPCTLEAMSALCIRTFEVEQMARRIVGRLYSVNSQLLVRAATSVEESTLATLAGIIFRVCKLLFEFELRQSPLSRFISRRAVLTRMKSIHEELDHFAGVADLESSEPSWLAAWDADKSVQDKCLQAVLSTDEGLLSGLTSFQERHDALLLLQYELRKYDELSKTDVSAFTESMIWRFLRVCDINVPEVPEWFISRDDADFEEWNMFETSEGIRKYDGRWLKTRVTITTSNLKQDQFQDAVSRWYQLNHPNVVKLYGACHIGLPYFFVYDLSPSDTKVLDYLAGKRSDARTWKCLYEAALGLQYLHHREVIHGDLRCDNFVVGSDLKTKIAGFGENHVLGHLYSGRSLANWRSPELMSGESGSLASDIYAFGMCILEALTLELPWKSTFVLEIIQQVQSGVLPERPPSMNDAQWDLITKMCAVNPNDRVNIVYVVNQLSVFATPGKKMAKQESEESELRAEEQLPLEGYMFAELGSTIEATLRNIKSKCEEFPESPWMTGKVYPALVYIFDLLHLSQKAPSDVEVVQYCNLLSQFQKYLRRAVSEKSIAVFTRSLKVAESHYVIYAKLDRLLDILDVPKTAPIRSWQQNRVEIETNILGPIRGESALVDKCQSIKPGLVSLIRYKAADPIPALASASISWYLPLRELVFGKDDILGQGAFGAVYKGVWLDTLVVVKFMGYEEDADTIPTSLFLHEVRVWHQLNHPHIVKLYGACHVGKRYFVCEYASNGGLREYLQANKSLKWKKLHEVALGLEYLHGLNIVHNDLKCDNVLVGTDGKAKLIDFGLSAIVNDAEIMVDVKQIGAIRWKSLEHLAGARPSFASDVYSFAMCILEVVTEDVPWGKRAADVFVRLHKRKGRIPDRPPIMTDKQWNLIRLMTRTNPFQRVKMAFVADTLFEISEDEMSPDGWQ